jgi:heavy metal translocating P-type ATPase
MDMNIHNNAVPPDQGTSMGSVQVKDTGTVSSQPEGLSVGSLDSTCDGFVNLRRLWAQRQMMIAGLAVIGIVINLFLRFLLHVAPSIYNAPLLMTLAVGGTPLVVELLLKLFRRQFGSDLLAGISIVTAAMLDQYLAGALVVLMLSGGEALERYAVGSASSVLRALAGRMPQIAHKKQGNKIVDVALHAVAIGDQLQVFPHELCPVDGVVIKGHGVMDEAYLTGEPFKISKIPGSNVLSGSINGESVLDIQATELAIDSRYAKIMRVMQASEHDRPHLRRLGDQLGAIYTPVAVGVAVLAWLISGQAVRFLAVLVIATPCPLLIAIPVAIIGAISLSARRGIIIKKPVVLEQVEGCRTIIFDKTGTLTYGEPSLAAIDIPEQALVKRDDILMLSASLERYSKHPLAGAIVKAAAEAGLSQHEATAISEPPGAGLTGTIEGHRVEITSRRKLLARDSSIQHLLPPHAGGLECVVCVDGRYVATFQFRDQPRADGVSFVKHLGPQHRFDRLMLVSGDRESEVRYLADRVGIAEVYAGKTPEEKLDIVRAATQKSRTLYIGDGINDAPALLAATVGVALGQNSDITIEAAGAVIMDSSLKKVDEFFHISHRMRSVALQSALGGMALSLIGMVLASLGLLPPVAGAVSQELIDLLAVLNALRAAFPPAALTDY